MIGDKGKLCILCFLYPFYVVLLDSDHFGTYKNHMMIGARNKYCAGVSSVSECFKEVSKASEFNINLENALDQ